MVFFKKKTDEDASKIREQIEIRLAEFHRIVNGISPEELYKLAIILRTAWQFVHVNLGEPEDFQKLSKKEQSKFYWEIRGVSKRVWADGQEELGYALNLLLMLFAALHYDLPDLAKEVADALEPLNKLAFEISIPIDK